MSRRTEMHLQQKSFVDCYSSLFFSSLQQCIFLLKEKCKPNPRECISREEVSLSLKHRSRSSLPFTSCIWKIASCLLPEKEKKIPSSKLGITEQGKETPETLSLMTERRRLTDVFLFPSWITSEEYKKKRKKEQTRMKIWKTQEDVIRITCETRFLSSSFRFLYFSHFAVSFPERNFDEMLLSPCVSSFYFFAICFVCGTRHECRLCFIEVELFFMSSSSLSFTSTELSFPSTILPHDWL